MLKTGKGSFTGNFWCFVVPAGHKTEDKVGMRDDLTAGSEQQKLVGEASGSITSSLLLSYQDPEDSRLGDKYERQRQRSPSLPTASLSSKVYLHKLYHSKRRITATAMIIPAIRLQNQR